MRQSRAFSNLTSVPVAVRWPTIRISTSSAFARRCAWVQVAGGKMVRPDGELSSGRLLQALVQELAAVFEPKSLQSASRWKGAHDSRNACSDRGPPQLPA